MKNIKKFLSLLLTFLLLTTGAINFNAYAYETLKQDKGNTNNVFLSEEEVFEALAYTSSNQALKRSINSQKKLSPSGAIIDSFDAESYSKYTNDEYGGMYLNDDGILVLCYVSESNTLKSLQKFSDEQNLLKTYKTLFNPNNEFVCNYTIKSVKYSESELLYAYDFVNKLCENGNKTIKTVDIDVFKNRIVIGIQKSSDIKKIVNDLSEIKGMFSFEILGDDFEVIEIATINGTSAINNGSTSTTPAGRMYSSTLNKYGVITCGHGWEVGDSVYSGSIKIGSVKYRKYNLTNDSSFIILNSGHSYSDTHYDEIDSSIPVVGSTLTLRGHTSGKISGAKVLSTNSTATNGIICTGLIKCDKKMQPGDSGGGAIGKIIDGGRTAQIVAINKATGNNYTLLVKGKVIINAYK